MTVSMNKNKQCSIVNNHISNKLQQQNIKLCKETDCLNRMHWQNTATGTHISLSV